jgi:hypothetical protein
MGFDRIGRVNNVDCPLFAPTRLPDNFGLTLLLLGSVAIAQTRHVDAPRYRLNEDIVCRSMTIVNRRSCLRGVRFGNVQLLDVHRRPEVTRPLPKFAVALAESTRKKNGDGGISASPI